ncbi:MAG: histidinol phosphate phosphatase [Candidatus Rokubacteria bacterium]|nr:histidinol phosphate phosphatase [Candidatus Rokubacteria bacterium]
MSRLLAVMVEAARAAGEIALKYFGRGLEVTLKADRSPVTQADREAEQVIVEILTGAFPEHGFLGEELGARGSTEVRWIVDPIDGTRNFVRGIPMWAVLIALEERGEITAGVILNPVSGELWTARKGRGAFLGTERIRVSQVSSLDKATLVHASLGLLRRGGHWDAFTRLVDATDRQRGFGDFMGYTVVAEGKAEIALEAPDLKPWDLAPVKLLVEEAGGRFSDFVGVSSIYSGTALASNGRLHDAALALIGGK